MAPPSAIGLPPTVEFFLWDAEEVTPIGLRHIESGSPAFLKIINTTESGALDFGRIQVSSASGGLSKTYAVTFRKKFVGNSGDGASIQNMRFWMPNHDSVLANLDKISFVYSNSGTWVGSNFLNNGTGQPVPSSLPDTQNVYRQDGSGAITSGSLMQNSYLDPDVSQFLYLAVQPSSDFPVGNFGFDSSSGMLFRVTYDYIGDINLND